MFYKYYHQFYLSSTLYSHILKNEKIATVAIGQKEISSFQHQVDKYTKASHFNLSKSASEIEIAGLTERLKAFDKIIISIHDMSQYSSKQFGLNESVISMASKISALKPSCTILFGSPYALQYFEDQIQSPSRWLLKKQQIEINQFLLM